MMGDHDDKALDELRKLTVVDVAATVGMKLGKDPTTCGSGPCPYCDTRKRRGQTTDPWGGVRISADLRTWYCRRCDVGGDVLVLLGCAAGAASPHGAIVDYRRLVEWSSHNGLIHDDGANNPGGAPAAVAVPGSLPVGIPAASVPLDEQLPAALDALTDSGEFLKWEVTGGAPVKNANRQIILVGSTAEQPEQPEQTEQSECCPYDGTGGGTSAYVLGVEAVASHT